MKLQRLSGAANETVLLHPHFFQILLLPELPFLHCFSVPPQGGDKGRLQPQPGSSCIAAVMAAVFAGRDMHNFFKHIGEIFQRAVAGCKCNFLDGQLR